MGNVWAIIGAAIAVSLTGVGSAIGMCWVQQAATGVTSEDPEKYGRTLILQLIPSSNALYGFVVGFLVVAQILFNGAVYTKEEGLAILGFCLPVAIIGMIACMAQAKVCTSGVVMVGKKTELLGRAITMAVFIELFALFGLIISVLGVLQIG